MPIRSASELCSSTLSSPRASAKKKEEDTFLLFLPSSLSPKVSPVRSSSPWHSQTLKMSERGEITLFFALYLTAHFREC